MSSRAGSVGMAAGLLALSSVALGCGKGPAAGSAGGGQAALPNPAAQACVSAGYRLEAILTNGVPTGHYCVDPATGKRCEVWAFHRGECSLKKTE